MNLSNYYRNYDEKSRLKRHWLEYELSIRTIQKHIPQFAVDVLDIGGGPGAYAFELSRRGH